MLIIFFFSLNIWDFSLLLCKNCTPWNLSFPFSPATPIWKLWSCQASPLCFKNFVGDWIPQQKWRGSHYISLMYNTYLEPQKLVIFGLQLCPINHKNCRSWNLKTHISSDVTSMNMKCSILARSWKFKKTRDNILLQIPFQSLTGKQKNSLLSTSRHINNITA